MGKCRICATTATAGSAKNACSRATWQRCVHVCGSGFWWLCPQPSDGSLQVAAQPATISIVFSVLTSHSPPEFCPSQNCKVPAVHSGVQCGRCGRYGHQEWRCTDTWRQFAAICVSSMLLLGSFGLEINTPGKSKGARRRAASVVPTSSKGRWI